jgi:hypothetical protein
VLAYIVHEFARIRRSNTNMYPDEREELVEMLPMDSESGQPQRKVPSLFIRVRTLFLRRCCTPRFGFTLILAVPCVMMLLFTSWPGFTPIRPPHFPPRPPHPPRPPRPPADSHDPVWSLRAASVKDAFKHAYGGYERYTTFPDDELKPVSNTGVRK